MNKKAISCLLLVVMLSTCIPVSSAGGLTKAERYVSALTELGKFFNDEAGMALEDIHSVFTALGGYKYSVPFGMYVEVLSCLEKEEYDHIFLLIRQLKRNDEFCGVLIESGYGTIDEIENYAKGRQAEINIDTDLAISYYEQSIAFADSMDRIYQLESQLFEQRYQEGIACYNEQTNDGYQKAYAIFSELAEMNYRDSQIFMNQLKEQMEVATNASIVTIDEEVFLLQPNIIVGPRHTIGLRPDGTVMAAGWTVNGLCNISNWTDIVDIAVGEQHIVGLKADGTVVAQGSNFYNQCNVDDWNEIVAIAASESHTVGLKKDGTVLATGQNNLGQCNVASWADVVDIAVSASYTVGLKSNGAVVFAGSSWDEIETQDEVASWREVQKVVASSNIVGLKRDGTVVAAGCLLDDGEGVPCIVPALPGVSAWTDIVAIAASNRHAVGLKADGTVVATGQNNLGQCNVHDWSGIVAIGTMQEVTVGLNGDGTIITAPVLSGTYDVSGWTDVVKISVGDHHIVGLRIDGTVVAAGKNDNGQCDVTSWHLLE